MVARRAACKYHIRTQHQGGMRPPAHKCRPARRATCEGSPRTTNRADRGANITALHSHLRKGAAQGGAYGARAAHRPQVLVDAVLEACEELVCVLVLPVGDRATDRKAT